MSPASDRTDDRISVPPDEDDNQAAGYRDLTARIATLTRDFSAVSPRAARADMITHPGPFRIAPVLDLGPAARRTTDPALSMLWVHANSGVEVS